MRHKFGYTQARIAQELNVDPRTVLNWENGHHEPRLTIRQVKQLYKLFEVSEVDKMPDNPFTEETADRSGDAIGGDI